MELDSKEGEMLVLTRRLGERIYIGEKKEIIVVVLEIKGGQVRLGIDAPPEVPVHREEIAERIARGEKSRPKLPNEPTQGRY